MTTKIKCPHCKKKFYTSITADIKATGFSFSNIRIVDLLTGKDLVSPRSTEETSTKTKTKKKKASQRPE